MARESSRRYSSCILNYIITRQLLCEISSLFGITLLMSSLVISSKFVEIDSKGIGTVTLKNVQNNSQGPQHTILFKVKTNLKDSVNVRPGYGLIPPSISKDTSHIQVKYTGGQAGLAKAKLMISWIAIERIIQDSKIAHEDFKQLFEKEVRISEGTTLMPFSDHSKNTREASSLQQQSNQETSESSDLLRQEKENDTATEAEHQLESSPIEQPQKDTEKPSKVHIEGYPLKVLILVFLISFICGVSVGWLIPQSSLPLFSAVHDNQQEYTVRIIPPQSRSEAEQEQVDL